MNVIICEDYAENREAIVHRVQEWAKVTGHDVRVTAFASSEVLLQQWVAGLQADILFLDIQFEGEIDGIELAKEIRKNNEYVPIVFITNYESYWRDGYEVNALRYLSKPITYETIAPCLEIAFQQRQLNREDFFVMEDTGRRIVIRFSEMVYVEAQSPYVVIRTQEHLTRVRQRLSQVAGCLNPLFVQCHRSYYVNLLHIRKMTRTEIAMSTGEILPLSRSYAEPLFHAFDAYYQGDML